jgi:F-type H+-transporting ATPase subunit b
LKFERFLRTSRPLPAVAVPFLAGRARRAATSELVISTSDCRNRGAVLGNAEGCWVGDRGWADATGAARALRHTSWRRAILMRATAATALVLASLLLSVPARAAGGGIEIMPDPGKLLPLVALFVLMIVPVNRLIIRPLLAVLDEREQRIAGSRARASEIAKRADQVLAGYEGSVARAREEAEVERRGTLDQARAAQTARVSREREEAERTLERARAEVGAALAQARTRLHADAQQLAEQAAERLLGRSL